VASFERDGYVVLRAAVPTAQLTELDRDTRALVDDWADGPPTVNGQPSPFAADAVYEPGPGAGQSTLSRMEYVVDKLPSCRRLLASPTVLGIVEQIQGPETIPTWDSMVVKMPGYGVAVPWHRDDSERKVAGGPPIFNLDIYVDDADEDTAVWVIPGSHRWNDHHAWTEALRRLEDDRFDTDGAVQLTMAAGDVLVHDVRLVHGSDASTTGSLRRVVYLEFRPVATELAVGPHTAEYIDRKRVVLAACLSGRPTEPGELRVVHATHWRD
jgi:ectoine hydroxylase-related dioxygenase (phytanoyl-CoA dioxygenase family)